MTGFDLIVLAIVAVAAIGGFLRGFRQEILSLAAWVLAVFAVRYMHVPLTDQLQQFVGYTQTVSILAFALLLLIPYAAMKVIANNVVHATTGGKLGPFDRVLGFGFGGIKGVVIVVIAFSLLVLGYDNVWGYRGRPTWMTTAQSYDFVDAGSRAMVEELAARRQAVIEADAERAGKARSPARK